MEMKIRPLGDRIVVRRAVAQSKEAFALQKGEVLAVGPGKYSPEKLVAAYWCRASSAVEVPLSAGYCPMHVKVGDVVLFTGGVEHDDIVVISEDSVLGVVEK